MQLGKRCSQILAEHPKNIIGRTELWYRLERIGNVLCDDSSLTGDIDSTKRYFPLESESALEQEVLRLKAQVLYLQRKINEMRLSRKKKGQPF